MSDTPICNRLMYNSLNDDCVHINTARKLERELTAAKEENARLRDVLTDVLGCACFHKLCRFCQKLVEDEKGGEK